MNLQSKPAGDDTIPRMQRILGIDYGTARIGIAAADLETKVAVPLTALAGRNDATRDARAVADAGAEQGAAAFVVGLPLNMDDSDSQQTALTRRFAGELARLSAKPVYFQDERLSSVAAADALHDVHGGRRSGQRRAKQSGRLDAVAAQRILQAYLDSPESVLPGR